MAAALSVCSVSRLCPCCQYVQASQRFVVPSLSFLDLDLDEVEGLEGSYLFCLRGVRAADG